MQRVGFIDLGRRFRTAEQSDAADPQLTLVLSSSGLGHSHGWPDLLQYPRVILLAEGGSGKTAEMRSQASTLQAAGKPAFYLPLEGGLLSELTAVERNRFDRWLASSDEVAWFFLDAVDELKLREGRLDGALRRLRNAIEGRLDRARVLISSRPSDWRFSIDQQRVESELPIVARGDSATADEESFLALLRSGVRPVRQPDSRSDPARSVRVVVLLPLDEAQIQTYARHAGVDSVEEFVREIRRTDSWDLANRPQDLHGLVPMWNRSHRLGTRTEQFENNIRTRLLQDDPERGDRGVLSDERLREGGERIALALTLMLTEGIRTPERTLDGSRGTFLDSRDILDGWDERQRQTLLRRALFDPATYGRVKFHHRSVREYLAACRLAALRRKGLSKRKLHALLFAEKYGHSIVVPSMRPIAAWMARNDVDVRRELIRREPETLLAFGDPESLPPTERDEILRGFHQAYGAGGFRGIRVPTDQIRRLAHPALAATVRQLWGDGPVNDDVRELLLAIIHFGQLGECADLVAPLARDTAIPDYQRAEAIRILKESRRTLELRRAAKALLNRPKKWSAELTTDAVRELFPTTIGAHDLVALAERASTPGNKSRIGWALERIVSAVDPLAPEAIELRDQLVSSILRGRDEELKVYRWHSRFGHFAVPLAHLCHRQLASEPMSRSGRLVEGALVAGLFGADETGGHKLVEALRESFSASDLRESAFWGAELLVAEWMPTLSDGRARLAYILRTGLVQGLTEVDRPWLEKAVGERENGPRRALALHGLLDLWTARGRLDAEANELLFRCLGNRRLRGMVVRRLSPEPHEPTAVEQQLERRRVAAQRKKAKQLDEWATWRAKIIKDPRAAFSGEAALSNVWRLYRWLQESRPNRNRLAVWDRKLVEVHFGPAVADGAALAFRGQWRAVRPSLRSQRSSIDVNRTPGEWVLGLNALAVEASEAGWATRLDPDSARTAAAYATVEWNGFPDWLKDLAEAHPRAVDEIIGHELSKELVDLGVDYLPILQSLSNAPTVVKRALQARLSSALDIQPVGYASARAVANAARHLDHMLSALAGTVDEGQHLEIKDRCAKSVSAIDTAPISVAWLSLLFRLDPNEAVATLERRLEGMPRNARVDYGVAAIASLVDGRGLIALESSDRRAHILGRLVRLAFDLAPPTEDPQHDGVHEVEVRDRAAHARRYLLSALLDTPGPDAQSVVQDLASGPLADMGERLRFLMRERAARDAEHAAMSASEVRALEDRYECPPRDDRALFETISERLEEVQHDVRDSDFTMRVTLQKVKHEVEIQRWLAGELDRNRREAYTVAREAAVADEKEPDILLTTNNGIGAAIEVKIADSWRFSQLQEALSRQLVGRYLRPRSRRVGCLVLTYHGHGRATWRNGRKTLDFGQCVDELRASARRMADTSSQRLWLDVVGIDLTGR
jgi:hypothetical protein